MCMMMDTITLEKLLKKLNKDCHEDKFLLDDGASNWSADCLLDAIYDACNSDDETEEEARKELNQEVVTSHLGIHRIVNGFMESIPMYSFKNLDDCRE